MSLGDLLLSFNFCIFFHSVKKVSKPNIFCEIICASKRTLVILIRIFFEKKMCNFVFSFICMIYKWRGDFIGSNFPRGRRIFSGGNFLGGNIMGGNFHRGELS